ncbi:hypothetical protein [Sphingobacterium tabacisoli]|uniref:Lipoprotein n=1 Tax=Sphingobacterium tabacisoli TaxID=2044855 RepID=A0ABW5L2N7_9SPHI|nr:hypothetical protein [Sphingobacterium tabacisoli]
MRKIIILLIAVTFVLGCKKSEETVDIPECIGEMVKRYEKELKCTKQGSMETNLYRGIYKNQQVYFANTMCINCNVMPPKYGYDCSGKKIDFSSFQDVRDIKQVYNSCTKKIIE